MNSPNKACLCVHSASCDEIVFVFFFKIKGISSAFHIQIRSTECGIEPGELSQALTYFITLFSLSFSYFCHALLQPAIYNILIVYQNFNICNDEVNKHGAMLEK